MKICIAGLGLIGGSLALALKRAGYKVCGYNRTREKLDYALSHGVVDEAADGFSDFDVVFVALPPEACVNFINSANFKDGAVVADICGVKRRLELEVYSRPRNFFYVGCHPMAGKEVSGVENACADLFDKASMVITTCEKTDPAAKEKIVKLTRDMGFACVVECSAAAHDKKIAYTSQLPHVLSNAYASSPSIKSSLGFTGGSFDDMTRIAGVDEVGWSSLYVINGENLAEEITTVIRALERIKEAVQSGDKKALAQVLADNKSAYVSGERSLSSPEFKITQLKKNK